MSVWRQLGLQDASSPIIYILVKFYDFAMLAVVLVVSLIFYAIVTLVFKKLSCYTVSEAQRVEAVWTIAPAVVLVILAIPSLRLLYQIDAISNPSLTVKAIGHQWYWRYEYNDFFDLEFNSYIVL